jgi:hypothetical protein
MGGRKEGRGSRFSLLLYLLKIFDSPVLLILEVFLFLII